MVKIIDIQDLSLLKITRVRSWSICFDYADKHYLLHGESEAGEYSCQELYERKLDECGKYDLIFISNKCGDDYVSNDYIKTQKGRTIVYSKIDKNFFAYKLTKRGFATGIFEKEVLKQNKEIEKLKKKLQTYEDKCREIRSQINELS